MNLSTLILFLIALFGAGLIFQSLTQYIPLLGQNAIIAFFISGGLAYVIYEWLKRKLRLRA